MPVYLTHIFSENSLANSVIHRVKDDISKSKTVHLSDFTHIIKVHTNISYISVDSLPNKDISNYYGIKALPSESENGAYFQFKKEFYELFFDDISCSLKWMVLDQKLKNAVYGPVMMYLPPEYTCSQP